MCVPITEPFMVRNTWPALDQLLCIAAHSAKPWLPILLLKDQLRTSVRLPLTIKRGMIKVANDVRDTTQLVCIHKSS